jgi:hypothetical protein
MMVAWHEMPGGRTGKIRPVGYGMNRVAPEPRSEFALINEVPIS